MSEAQAHILRRGASPLATHAPRAGNQGRAVHARSDGVLLTIVERVNLPEMLLPAAHSGLHAVPPAKRGRRARSRRRGRAPLAASPALGQVPASYEPLRIGLLRELGPQQPGFVATALSRHRLAGSRAVALHYRRWATGRRRTTLSSRPGCNRRASKFPTMPLLNNSDGTIWHIPEMAAMLRNPPRGSVWCRHLVEQIVKASRSVWRSTSSRCRRQSQRDFVTFVGELAAGLHGADLKLMVALPGRRLGLRLCRHRARGGRHHPDEL